VAGPESCDGSRVDVVEGQVLDIGKRVARVVHSDPSLAFRCGVEQRRLDIQMGLVGDQPAAFGRDCGFTLAFKLIHKYFILVNRRANNQIRSFLFDQEVAVSSNLIEPCAGSYSKYCFPSILPGQAVVQFISELHCLGVDVEFRVKIHVAA